MRSSNKSRSRSKSNRNRSNNNNNLGNVVNRVFDSSGPEGKVRGTPQQIIDKYQMLARDAQLAGDRVATENFLQHSEHYTRMLNEAQREMNERREQQEAQRQSQQNNQNQNHQNHQNNQNNQNQQPQQNQQAQPQQNNQSKKDQQPQQIAITVMDDQPDLPNSSTADLFPGQDDGNLVTTPESQSKKPAPKPRAPTKSSSKAAEKPTVKPAAKSTAKPEKVVTSKASDASQSDQPAAEPKVASQKPEQAEQT